MSAPRILAIDPGQHAHGWALLEQVAPRRYAVPLWGHGSTDSVATFLRDHETYGELCVAIERPAGFGFSQARVVRLLEARGEAGRLAGIAGEHGRELVEVRAEVWRKLLTGRASADDAMVAKVLGWAAASHTGALVALPDCDGKERSHVFDAIGLGLMLAREGAQRLRELEAALHRRDIDRGQQLEMRAVPGARVGARRGARR